ncbi:hypothetical protein U1Q18_021016 [Sarracenia purpurea var. burkii]
MLSPSERLHHFNFLKIVIWAPHLVLPHLVDNPSPTFKLQPIYKQLKILIPSPQKLLRHFFSNRAKKGLMLEIHEQVEPLRLANHEKVGFEYSDSSVSNHHYIPREDFNNYNNGGGATQGSDVHSGGKA